MKKLILLTVASSTLLVSGCQSTWVNHQSPDLTQYTAEQNDWSSIYPKNGKDLAVSSSTTVSNTWWETLNEPALNALIEKAYSNNASIQIASATLEQAHANWQAIDAGLKPLLAASATANREKNVAGIIGDFSQAGVSLDYTLDLFGKNASLENAAQYQYLQQGELLDYAKSVLASNITAAYIQYHALEQQHRILQDSVASQEETVSLNQRLYDTGELAQTALDRVSSEYYLTQAQANDVKRLSNQLLIQLAQLLTVDVQTVNALLTQHNGQNKDQPITFNSLPILQEKVQLLANRPDVKAQEYSVLAASEITKSQLASIYPDISLSGFFGLADTGLSLSETVWNIGANAAVRLIDFGQRDALNTLEKAKEKAAIAQYQQSVNNALIEVEQILNDITAYQQQTTHYQNAAQSSRQAYQSAQSLYQEGEASLLDLLDVQRVKNQTELSLLQAQANTQVAIATLYRALTIIAVE